MSFLPAFNCVVIEIVCALHTYTEIKQYVYLHTYKHTYIHTHTYTHAHTQQTNIGKHTKCYALFRHSILCFQLNSIYFNYEITTD